MDIKFDTKCRCGWDLPQSVMPHHNVANAGMTEDTIVPNVIVCLLCPQCHRGHSFLSFEAAVKATEIDKRRLGIKVRD